MGTSRETLMSSCPSLTPGPPLEPPPPPPETPWQKASPQGPWPDSLLGRKESLQWGGGKGRSLPPMCAPGSLLPSAGLSFPVCGRAVKADEKYVTLTNQLLHQASFLLS